MVKGTYSFEHLQNFCNENKIILIKSYDDCKVTRDTIIEGKCINNDCDSDFNKVFRQLKKSGGYCKKCTNNITKINIQNTCFKKYGVQHTFQVKDIREKGKNTIMQKYGVENVSQNNNIKLQKKETCFKNHGVEISSQSNEIRKKIKQTCLDKYGVDNPFQNNEIKDKIKQTCLDKYGVENPQQNNKIKEKTVETNIQKYGVSCPLNNELIKDKSKITCLEKYGVEHISHSVKIKEKIKQTCLDKYGYEYPQQNPEFAQKVSNNSYKLKLYTLPSGKIIYIQGYEHFALDELLKTINETNILNNKIDLPPIWYNDINNKKHRHYVDIFIPSENLCIEVKSTWTIEKKKDNVFLKQQAAKELGYKYEIWVYNAKGEKVECYI
jgi:hypothetical protein